MVTFMSSGSMNGGVVTIPSALAFSSALIMMSMPDPKNIWLVPFTPILKASQTVSSPVVSTYKGEEMQKWSNLLMDNFVLDFPQ